MDEEGKGALGIKVWYCPKQQVSIVADIVAVHGFAAHPYRTWVGKHKERKNTSTSKPIRDGKPISTDVAWLETLLPAHIPNCRVLSFGYESEYIHRAPKRSIGNCAQELLTALDLERSGTQWGHRPIIFLGHSFGGIVIKEAMVKASLASQHFGHLKWSTHGIVFLGTPHCGSPIAAYGETLVAAAKVVAWNVDTRLLSSLRRSSVELLRLAEYFGDIHEDFEIHCFYELLPWRFGKVIVDELSAVIPGKPKDGLTTNHSGMNKYTDVDDPNLKKIVGALDKMVASAAQQESHDGISPQSTKQVSQIEASSSGSRPLSYAVGLVRKVEILFDHKLKAIMAHPILQDGWIPLNLQRQQFQSWTYTVGLGSMFGMTRALHPSLSLSTITEISHILEEIVDTLSRTTSDCSRTQSSQALAVIEDLENHFISLLACLPIDQRGILRHVMTTSLVQSPEAFEHSGDVAHTTSLSDVETISAMRRINLLIQRSEARRTSDNLFIKLGSELVLDKHKSPIRTPGKLFQDKSKGRVFSQVLVEWKHYEGLWDTQIGNELFQRMELLTDFLRTASQDHANEILRFLECCGYCHDQDQKRLGFVFLIPPSVTQRSSYIRLNTLLKAFAAQQVMPPSVDDRIHLARTLCTAMFEFHNAGWFHKGFCTHNILVFSEVDLEEPNDVNDDNATHHEINVRKYSILAPYIVGFNHSRPSKPTEFSEPTTLSDELRRYSHPANKHIPEQKYLHEYDYYSLGVVLLEIGQWTPLSSMMHGKMSLEKSSAFEFADTLRTAKCAELNAFVGIAYEDAVAGLLTAFDEERVGLDQNEYVSNGELLQFQTDVLDCLGGL